MPVPQDNPQTAEKVALGKKLFDDTRFSTTGEVACATCHDERKAYTDSSLVTAEGINKLIAILSYVHQERRGARLAPGRH